MIDPCWQEQSPLPAAYLCYLAMSVPMGMNVYGEYHPRESWRQLAHCWKR
jgi:hypothetical protein